MVLAARWHHSVQTHQAQWRHSTARSTKEEREQHAAPRGPNLRLPKEPTGTKLFELHSDDDGRAGRDESMKLPVVDTQSSVCKWHAAAELRDSGNDLLLDADVAASLAIGVELLAGRT